MAQKHPLRIMISWGDTAGHIYMGVALADHAVRHLQAPEIAFVGAAGRLPPQRMQTLGYDVHFLDISPYDRTHPLKNGRLPFQFLRSMGQSFSILRRRRPHVVLGLGGYPSGPFVCAARLKGIPTLLVEPNLFPGLANRLLARWVDRVCLSFRETAGYFPPRKVTFTGTPVRHTVWPSSLSKKEACASLGLDPRLKTVVIMGGSLGLQSINEAILKHIARLEEKRIQLIWQTGDRHFAGIQEILRRSGAPLCRVFPFIEEITLPYAAADLVVTAGGAVTMAELSLWRKPAIIIPSSKATEGHQIINARKYATEGACIYIDEQEAAGLIDIILKVVQNPDTLNQLAAGIFRFARPAANDLILREIQALTHVGHG